MILKCVSQDLVVQLDSLFLLVHPCCFKFGIFRVLIGLTCKDFENEVLVLLVLDRLLEILRNLTKHVKLFKPLFPAVCDLSVRPHFKTDKGYIDELFDTSILLECLKESTVLNILALNLIKQVTRLVVSLSIES